MFGIIHYICAYKTKSMIKYFMETVKPQLDKKDIEMCRNIVYKKYNKNSAKRIMKIIIQNSENQKKLL